MHRYLYTEFTAALFTIARRWKTTQMFIDRCMDEQYVREHTMEYYLALKLKEIRTPPIMWVNLKDMMLMK